MVWKPDHSLCSFLCLAEFKPLKFPSGHPTGTYAKAVRQSIFRKVRQTIWSTIEYPANILGPYEGDQLLELAASLGSILNDKVTRNFLFEINDKVKCKSCEAEFNGIQYGGEMITDFEESACNILYSFATLNIKTEVGIYSCDTGERIKFTGDRVIIEEGSPLVKIFQKKGCDYQCSFCFEQSFPEVFHQVCMQLEGKAAIMNFNGTLHKISFGKP